MLTSVAPRLPRREEEEEAVESQVTVGGPAPPAIARPDAGCTKLTRCAVQPQPLFVTPLFRSAEKNRLVKK